MNAETRLSKLVYAMMEQKGYNSDITWLDYSNDNSIPKEDRQFFRNAIDMWSYLYDEGLIADKKEPVQPSCSLFHTPKSLDELVGVIAGLPMEHQATGYTLVQMTINYINSKE